MQAMSRRKMIERVITGTAALAVGGPVVLMQTGCDNKKQLVRWAITGLQILDEISPTLEMMGAHEIVALIDKAVPYAEKLKQALENNDTTSAKNIIENLLGADGWMAKIATAVGLLKDEHRRNIIMGSLAIAQVAYHLILEQVRNDMPPTVASEVNKSQPEAMAVIKRSPNRLKLAFEATRF